MDEFDVIVLLVKGIVWIVKTVFLIVTLPFRLVLRSVRGAQAKETAAAEEKPSKRAVARPQQAPRKATIDDVVTPVQKLANEVSALRELASGRANTRPFVVTLAAQHERLDALLTQLRRRTVERPPALAMLGREKALALLVSLLVDERRGPLADLLADTDALANASYAPIVEFCTRRGIELSSDRAATAIDGDKLFFMSVDDPSGLTAIVVPASFSTEIMTWPAIAHEIGHDFFNSVRGLPAQLRERLALGTNIALVKPEDNPKVLEHAPQRAVAAWMEELFADSFGTMMLGPAYIETMMASFGSPKEPTRALACAPRDDLQAYEEHPPGHVRVIAGCRLLGQMGYGKIADQLERRWRKAHGEPDVLFIPLTNGRWVRLPEAAILERAAQVGSSLYLEGLPALRGQPLRSIAGLDFGPREHEAAGRAAEQLKMSRPPQLRDARLLVAGAVLATVQTPRNANDIYALARDAIGGIDVPNSVANNDVGDEDAIREAIIFGELLAPPLSRRAR